jgi:hypothetical protein
MYLLLVTLVVCWRIYFPLTPLADKKKYKYTTRGIPAFLTSFVFLIV